MLKTSENPTLITQRMKDKGLRITPQRFAVYANLLSRDDHPTVEAILQDINQELPIASKASIYSTLTILREVGLVREVLLEEGVTRYDGKITPHHHFICQKCKAIADLDWETFENLALNKLPSNLRAESYEVTVQGLCSNCQSL